jgi:hypothetical protein
MSNWRLPTRNELKTMYVRLHQKGLGGFASDFYWSSSEYSNHYAWFQYFGNGTRNVSCKDSKHPVRLVQDLPEVNSSKNLVLTLSGKYFEVALKDEPKLMTWYKAMKKHGTSV